MWLKNLAGCVAPRLQYTSERPRLRSVGRPRRRTNPGRLSFALVCVLPSSGACFCAPDQLFSRQNPPRCPGAICLCLWIQNLKRNEIEGIQMLFKETSTE